MNETPTNTPPTNETPKGEPTKEANAPAASASTGKVAETLAGKLVKVSGDGVADHALTGSPEYYVLYYSASWRWLRARRLRLRMSPAAAPNSRSARSRRENTTRSTSK